MLIKRTCDSKLQTLRMRYTHSNLPADQFHTETGVSLHLHDTVARFRTRVKFSPRYKNQGELTPG